MPVICAVLCLAAVDVMATGPAHAAATTEVDADLVAPPGEPELVAADGNAPVVAEPDDEPPADFTIERWNDFPGQSLGDVPHNTLPSPVEYVAGSFESARNDGDEHATRMRALVTPTESGRYRLFLSADDDARLFFNRRGADAVDARQVAYVAGWTTPGQWDRYRSQRSRWFNLEAGQAYYIEAIAKEGSGDDHLMVGWQRRGESGIEVLPAEVLEATEIGGGGWRTATPFGLVGKPDELSNPQWKVTPDATSVTVEWNNPDGVHWFDVRLEGHGEQQRIRRLAPGSGERTAVRFEGLVPETRYLVHVAAKNRGGRTAPAAVVAFTDKGDYQLPERPVEDPNGSPTVTVDRWFQGGWTLSSIPEGTPPDTTDTLAWGMESDPDEPANSATRLRALVTPPIDGEYRFHLSSDDDGRLMFSRNGRADRARTIASVAGWTEQYQWDRFVSQESRTFRLRAGRSYYIEAIAVHAGGLSHLEVGWSINGGDVHVIPAANLQPTELGQGGWRQDLAAIPRRPARISALTTTATDTGISVLWEAPAVSERHGAADAYEVTVTRRGERVGQSIWVDASGTGAEELTVPNLDADTGYRVRIRAWNAGGQGRARGATVRTTALPQ
ncbi:MAG: fibronectin type III domain-containing protein [Actinomycetota bacterium]